MNAECYLCHLRRNVATARALSGEETATACAKDLMALYLSAPEDASAPWFGPGVSKLLEKHCGLSGDRYKKEKEDSNRFVLERLDTIRQKAESADDPVYAGLQLAVLGNYLDYSALQGEVSFEKLDEMLDSAADIHLDRQVYGQLMADLEKGKTLLYLTDNAGEIGFDRVLAELLKKRFPHLAITFCVRGAPAANDATREDAAIVGIDFPVIDNGTDFAGTVLRCIGPEARQAFESADVILSKGQGNVETLLGCGYNVYYAFLVKCVRFASYFQAPMMEPLFLREKK